MEKQLSRSHDDNYDNEANAEATEYRKSLGLTECKYTKWFRRIPGKFILVILIVGVFIVAQTFRLPAKWQTDCLHRYNTISSLATTKATKGLQSWWNHDVPVFPQAPLPGISIAVSIDPDTNMQLYDLDSAGVLRIRRRTNSSDQTNTKWTSPQIIPADPKPKKSSPLAAFAFQLNAGVSHFRVYYLDESNRIVEFGASSSDSSWSLTQHFSTTSTGGLAAVWLGGWGIRVYFINEDSSVGELVWSEDSWYSPASLDLPALTGSSLAAQAVYLEPGNFYGIFLHYVNSNKALTEGQYFPQADPIKFHPGRIIDPDFTIIGSGLATAIAVDDNSHFWRAYYLEKGRGLMAREAGPPEKTEYGEFWLRGFNSPSADVLGGAVAAVTWKDNIRVFYLSGQSLVEAAKFFTSEGETLWYPLGQIK